jgi:uncharacterized membrane protein YbhN (UPF0104 family)
MRRGWLNVLRVLISVGALAFLFWRVDLGETLGELRQANLRYLFAAFLLFILSLVIRAYRWLVLVRGLDPAVPFGRLLRLYFAGAFFNAFLPSTYGGDVVRALELAQDSDPSAAIGTVLLDRMSGLMMLSVMGLVVLPFQAAWMERWLAWLLFGLAVGILVVGALVLEGRLLRRLTARLPFGLSLAGQGALARVYAAVTGCGWRAITGAFGISILFNILNVVIYWLCGQALETGIGLGYFFASTMLISVSGLVPSVGGWGVREIVSAALFAPAGAEKAVAVGTAINLVTLAAGLVGGAVYLVESIYKMLTERRGE